MADIDWSDDPREVVTLWSGSVTTTLDSWAQTFIVIPLAAAFDSYELIPSTNFVVVIDIIPFIGLSNDVEYTEAVSEPNIIGLDYNSTDPLTSITSAASIRVIPFGAYIVGVNLNPEQYWG